MSWNIEWNGWTCSVCQERNTCLVSKWHPGGAWKHFSRSKIHYFISMKNCTEPRPILNNILRSWNIGLLHVKQENIPFKKYESPFFLFKATLSVSKETLGKSVYLFEDCLVRMESEEGLLHADPARLDKVHWNKSITGWDHLPINRLLWFPRFRAFCSPGNYLQPCISKSYFLLFVCFLFSLMLSLKEFAFLS